MDDMATLKRFDKVDWMGMAGAEPFADGSDPFVAYDVKVDELDTVVIVDGTGVAIQILTPEGEDVSYGYLTGSHTALFVLTLKDAYETGELVDMGFEFHTAD
jgi:hypothetical protein